MADHPAPSIPGRLRPVYNPYTRILAWPPATVGDWAAWCSSVVASGTAQTIPQDK